MQWPTDLIGYDTMASYGSPGYWVQQMFSAHHGDMILPAIEENVPLKDWQPPQGRAGADSKLPPLGPVQHVPTLFESATRDSKTGMIYLKLVNRAGAPQAVKVEIAGLASVESKGQCLTMAASSPEETNTVTEPTKISPKLTAADNLGARFTRTLPPYSITILEMKAK